MPPVRLNDPSRPATRRAAALLSVMLAALILAGCGSAETTASDATATPSATPTPTSYPVPSDCPTADDLSEAFGDKAGFYEPIALDLLSSQVATPLPKGGCAYAALGMKSAKVTADGQKFQWIHVFYFRLGESGTSVASLKKWGAEAGGPQVTGDQDTVDLPTAFSGFTKSTADWVAQGDLLFRPDNAIPQYTRGSLGRVTFALDDGRTQEILKQTSSGRTESDPTVALASGLAAPIVAAVNAKDAKGYTVDVSVNGSLKPFTKDITHADPGRFRLVMDVAGTSTIANTTSGRRSPTPGLTIEAVYPHSSSVCSSLGWAAIYREGENDASFCRIVIGRTGAQQVDPGAKIADPLKDDVDSLPASTTFDETTDALAQANTPLAIYVLLNDSSDDWTASRGCELAGDWYVAADGWPDPICAP